VEGESLYTETIRPIPQTYTEETMTNSLNMSTTLPAAPQKLYEAWLNSEEHALFTGGGHAEVDPRVGGAFSAWDGYIMGKTLELEPYSHILQAWRTTDFPEGAPDSLLEVLIQPDGQGSKLTLIHTQIPEGQEGEYRQGWEDYYFKPMQDYFGGKA
jgi:activator of HSP90 ATPase